MRSIMKIFKVTVGPLQENCYIVADEATKEAFIIDPGDEEKRIMNVIQKEALIPRFIINTHGHYDHIGKNHVFNLPIYIHEDDNSFLSEPQKNYSTMLGMQYRSPQAAKLLKDGDTISFGTETIHIIHTPGHTPGGICLRINKILFTGDTLFHNSIGRSDFPYGDGKALIRGITERLVPLGDDVTIYPGHGEKSTIGWERKNNFFLSRSAT
jgi:hydroxyacylglutathione hydrolase